MTAFIRSMPSDVLINLCFTGSSKEPVNTSKRQKVLGTWMYPSRDICENLKLLFLM